MPLQNMKIRTGLFLAFGVILILVISMGAITYVQTEDMWEQTDHLYKHPFAVNIAIREIQTNVMAMSRSMKDVVLFENQAEIDKHVHGIDVYEGNVFKLFDTVYAQYLGKKEDVDRAYNAFRDWKPVRNETIRLRRQGKIAEAARRSTKGAGDESVERIMESTNKLRDFALQRAVEFHASAHEEKTGLHVQILVVLSVIIVLLIGIFYVIMRRINTPLKELTQVADKHRRGQYDARSALTLTNEFGQLAGAFNEMAQAVQSEITVKSGVTAIADSMLGKEELAAFTSNLLGVLLSTTHSNIGAIYFLNDEKALFEHYCSVGLSQENIKSFSANTKEGEFGAALSEKKLQRIMLIPDDTIFDFSVVAGTFRPKEIITIPILRQDQVVAVISLAGIQAYSPETIDILAIAENNITTGINSILSFENIREYFQRLSIQNDQLEEQSRELRTQAEELQEQNAELAMQRRQIEEANRLKSEFLSNMSHELRTPLNSVIALSGVLHRRLQRQIPDEEYSYLEIIERNGKDLLVLINDILDLSRIEAGKAEIEYNTFSIGEIVQSIVTILKTQIEDKNIQVINSIGPETPMIVSDRSKCHHVLQNIIGNAVKFTDKGSIEITARQVANDLYISVKDTGIGIPAHQLSYIFEEFRQADGTASRKHEGTGLGLAIVAKYSALLGGRIEVDSKPGEGSTFTFILPVEQPGQQTAAIASSRHSGGQPGRPVATHSASSMAGKRILIIEDSDPAIVQISEILKQEGYIVDIARSGPDALAAVKITIPDAIILDLMMPGMDGFEVLQKIRGTEDTAKIPVLILTAKYVSKSELARLTENNIHQIIQKGSIGKDELLAEINGIFVSPVAPIVKEGKATILLIDDNADDAKAVKALLGETHDIISAMDGYIGIEKAKKIGPDIILLDISLPRMDGFEIFDELRKEGVLKNIPVIAITARAMKGDREEILQYGFDGYISKPIDREFFEKTLQKWLKGDPRCQ